MTGRSHSSPHGYQRKIIAKSRSSSFPSLHRRGLLPAAGAGSRVRACLGRGRPGWRQAEGSAQGVLDPQPLLTTPTFTAGPPGWCGLGRTFHRLSQVTARPITCQVAVAQTERAFDLLFSVKSRGRRPRLEARGARRGHREGARPGPLRPVHRRECGDRSGARAPCARRVHASRWLTF